MIPFDRDDDKWRDTLVRVLLCIAMCVYLGILVAYSFMRFGSNATLGYTMVGSLSALCAFGALGLTRARVASVVFIGIAALLSVGLLVRAAFQSRLVTLLTGGETMHWQAFIALSLAFAVYSLPIAAFVIAWPRLRSVSAHTSDSAIIPDNSAAPPSASAVPRE